MAGLSVQMLYCKQRDEKIRSRVEFMEGCLPEL